MGKRRVRKAALGVHVCCERSSEATMRLDIVWKSVVGLAVLAAFAFVGFHELNEYALAQKQWSGDLVMDHFYIGRLFDEYHLEDLQAHNIQNVLTINEGQQMSHQRDINYMHIRAKDNDEQNILDYFNVTNAFIQGAIERGENVMVNCMHAHSRSPSFMMAFGMYYNGWGFSDAYYYVKQKHAKAHPKQELQAQLMLYDAILRGDMTWEEAQARNAKRSRKAMVLTSDRSTGVSRVEKQPVEELTIWETLCAYAWHYWFMLGNYNFYYGLTYIGAI